MLTLVMLLVLQAERGVQGRIDLPPCTFINQKGELESIPNCTTTWTNPAPIATPHCVAESDLAAWVEKHCKVVRYQKPQQCIWGKEQDDGQIHVYYVDPCSPPEIGYKLKCK